MLTEVQNDVRKEPRVRQAFALESRLRNTAGSHWQNINKLRSGLEKIASVLPVSVRLRTAPSESRQSRRREQREKHLKMWKCIRMSITSGATGQFMLRSNYKSACTLHHQEDQVFHWFGSFSDTFENIFLSF